MKQDRRKKRMEPLGGGEMDGKRTSPDPRGNRHDAWGRGRPVRGDSNEKSKERSQLVQGQGKKWGTQRGKRLGGKGAQNRVANAGEEKRRMMRGNLKEAIVGVLKEKTKGAYGGVTAK